MKENAFENLRGFFAFFVVLLLRKRHKEDAKGTKKSLFKNNPHFKISTIRS